MILTTEAHGFKIVFDTSYQKYTVYSGTDVVKESKSEEAVLKFIENPEKKEKKNFKRIPVFMISGKILVRGEATAPAESRYSVQEIWATFVNNGRGKYDAQKLVLDTNENVAIAESIIKKRQEVTDMEQSIYKIQKELTCVSHEMFAE